MLNAVMVDLETMGSGSRSAIVAIGAFKFDLYQPQAPEQIEDSQKFYTNVDLKSCLKAGLVADGDTIMWWLKQEKVAQDALSNLRHPPKPLEAALLEFTAWLGAGKWTVWGNGATFDNVILRNAYEAVSFTAPWHYTKDCCYRTYKNLHGKTIPYVRQGTAHNALDDAITQALHLQKIMATIRQTSDPQTTLPI